ncbi:MAG: pyridoxamine 5'-phosphate oxidase family protein [Bacteroidota bacterium]
MNELSRPVDKQIVKFIQKHHILTLATTHNNIPYCATCFYAYNSEKNIFVFTSDKHTRHIMEASEQYLVAGAIALETRIIGKIQGVQFTGKISELTEDRLKLFRKDYLKRFPYAKPFLHDTTFWSISPSFFKLTDNNLGFGKKLIWNAMADLD